MCCRRLCLGECRELGRSETVKKSSMDTGQLGKALRSPGSCPPFLVLDLTLCSLETSPLPSLCASVPLHSQAPGNMDAVYSLQSEGQPGGKDSQCPPLAERKWGQLKIVGKTRS